MVNKNIQMKKREGNDWDNLFPLTLKENVYNEDGLSLDVEMDQMNTEIDYLNEVVVNVKKLGAKGNGIDSDVNAIFLGSQSNVTLGFPNGVYVIDKNLKIQNKKIKWVTLGDDVVFLDTGLPVTLDNGSSSLAPNGIFFENCDVEMVGFKHRNNLTINQSGQISIADEQHIKPFIQFVGGKVVFNDIKIDGFTQPWLKTSPLGSPSGLFSFSQSAYVNFFDCEQVEFKNNDALNIGLGELYFFLNIENLIVENSKHIQEVGGSRFWSYCKAIACKNVTMDNLKISSTSTGSLMDVSGDYIKLENLDTDYPNGKFMDITQEWGTANYDTNYVEIKNSKTNADLLAFNSISEFGNIKEVKKVHLENIDWKPEISSNNRTGIQLPYTRETVVKNISFDGVKVLNNLENANGYTIQIFEDISMISSDETDDGKTRIETHGETIIENSTISGNFHNVLELRDREHFPSGILMNSTNKIVFKNCALHYMEIELFANVEFIDCTFNNVSFRERFNIQQPSVSFDNCVFSYGNSFPDGWSPFFAGQLGDLTIKNSEYRGFFKTDDQMIVDLRDVTGQINVDNIDLTKLTSTHIFFRFNEDRLSRSSLRINFENVKGSKLTKENMRYMRTTTAKDITLNFKNNTIEKDDSVTNRQVIYFLNTESSNFSNLNLSLVGNVFLEGNLTPLSALETSFTFKSFANAGNDEW